METPWLQHHCSNSWSDVTEEQFRAAYQISTSFVDVARRLGYPPTARRRLQVQQIAEHLGLDLLRFEGKRGTGGGRNWLGADHHLQLKKTKGKLVSLHKSLREKGRACLCESCGLGPEWNSEKLVLQIDHRNGNHFDNQEENLRFLCPNCHSQTPTFAGRNRQKS